MHIKNVTLIIIAVLGISILASNEFYVKPAMAQFTVFSKLNFTTNVIASFYQSATGYLWVVTDNGAHSTFLYGLDTNHGNTQISAKNITEVVGSATFHATDLWCSSNVCFISYATEYFQTLYGSDYRGLVIGVNSVSDPLLGLIAGMNITGTYINNTHGSSSGGVIKLSGKEQNTGGIGGVYVFAMTCYNQGGGVCRNELQLINGDIFQISANLGDLDGTNTNLQIDGLQWNGIFGITDDYLVTAFSQIGGGGNQKMKIYNLATLTSVCSATVRTGINGGGSLALNTDITNHRYYIGGDSGIIKVYDKSCNYKNTMGSSNSTGLSNTVTKLQVIADTTYNATNSAGALIAQESGANALISVMNYNTTSGIKSTGTTATILNTFPLTSQPTTGAYGRFTRNQYILYTPYYSTTDKAVLIFRWLETPTNPSNGITDGICHGLLRDCLPSAGGGLSGFLPHGYNLTQAGTTIGQGLGIVDPENDNQQTNGVGIFMMLATGTLFAGITFATIATANNKFGTSIQYSEIPKEYWLFLVVAVVGLAFYLHWIPDILFYGMIIGLAGLFSFGIYSHFKGRGG